MAYDEKLAERVRVALGGRTDVSEKQMFGGVAFMVRGHMCCGIVGPSLMIRVPREETEALLARAHTRPMDFTGRAMRGFLFVDPPGIRTAAALAKWVALAVAHAETLPRRPAKPGRRRRR